MKIAVFMGGISAEREVSLKTGDAILKSLLKQGYDAYGVNLVKETMVSAFIENEYDIAFLALHGEYGEDGRVQGLLDMLGKKYTGSGATASAIAMDKMVTKMVAEEIGIRIPNTYRSMEEIKTYPVVVKPVAEGSSVGLYICHTPAEVGSALLKLEKKNPIIEEFVKGEELTAGVLDGEALGVLKIKPHDGTYDYESKYTAGKTDYEYPAEIAEEEYKRAMKYAKQIHHELGLKGGTRSDFILSEGNVYFLEVNTCPGMTQTSLLPKLATLKGYTFDDVVKKILTSIA